MGCSHGHPDGGAADGLARRLDEDRLVQRGSGVSSAAVDSGGGKSLACVSSAGAASSSEFIGTIRGMREGDRVSPQEHGDISD